MAHIVQCRTCKKTFDIELVSKDYWVMPSRNWYYHTECYNTFKKKKSDADGGDMNVELNDQMWFWAMCDYLEKDLKMKINYALITQQWQNLIKKGKTAKGIYFVLRYFYEIKHGDVSKANGGIGIIDYIYEEGAQYWAERVQRDKNICEQIEKQIMAARQRIVQTINVRKSKNLPKDKINLSLSSIGEMEDEED